MNDRKLFHYQEAAFQDLLQTAKAFFDPSWHEFRIKPRFSRLVVGPSGVGKTHIVRALAEEMQVPLFSIDVSNWILLGASAAERSGETWRHICKFIAENERGIIFLDELDKLGRAGAINDSAWTQHLRVEVYGLLDKRIPAGLIMPPADKEASAPSSLSNLLESSHNEMSQFLERIDLHLRPGHEIDGANRVTLDFATAAKRGPAVKLAERLGRNILIIGAGAFQGLWEDWGKARIGIGQNEPDKGRELKHRDLQSIIPTELTNRFAATPVVIKPLQDKDYRQMLYRAACKLPKNVASRMVRSGIREIAPAIENGLGVRWVESLLLQSLTQGEAPFKACTATSNSNTTCGALE